MEKNIFLKKEDGITVEELLKFLGQCPPKAKVILDHKAQISNPEDNGTCSYGWVFDEFIEARCEEIEDESRYNEYKSENKIVWLTHQKY